MLAAALIFSNDERFLIAPVIGVMAGVYWFYKGFRLLRRKRLIQNTPASKIRSASMGLVEISGLASGPYVMKSPLRQVDCYYYKSTAWELRRHGKNSDWVKVAEENLQVPFYLDDGTDKVMVDPRGAELDLHADFQQEYHRSILFEGPDMPGSVREFLLRHGANPDKRIKVEEHCIKPKNFLFVLGTLSQNPGLDASVMPPWAERVGANSNQPAAVEVLQPEVIRISEPAAGVPATAMTQQQKIAAALTRAGSAGSWNAVQPNGGVAVASVGKAPTVVEPRPAAEVIGSFDLHPPVVLLKGSHEPAFFISWRSQREVVAPLGWKSGLMIWGAPALTLASIYFLLAHFGAL